MATQTASSVGPDGRQQLPPVVHAIGGSIGSALAILTFYPLERIRVELQSSVGDVDTGSRRKSGQSKFEGKVKISNNSLNHTNPRRRQSQMEVIHECDESYEVISSSLRSADVVSIDTFPSEEEAESDAEDEDYTALRQAHSLPNVDSISDEPTSHLEDTKCNNELNEGIRCNEVPKTPPSNESKSSQHQTSKETIIQCLLRLRSEGSLYKGASHMVITLMISNAIFFYALQVARRRLAALQHHRHHGKKNHSIPLRHYLHLVIPKSKMGKSLISSSLAGVINVLLTNPLWVASLRIMESKLPLKDDKVQYQQNLWNVMHGIAKTEGISHLWNGTGTSLLLVSNPIIQHFIYEQLRLWLLDLRGRRTGNQQDRHHNLKASSLSPTEAFFFGALAKTAATIATYPLQLAQVLLRLQSKKLEQSQNPNDTRTRSLIEDGDKEVAYTGTLDCLYQQFSSGGMPALFHGMNAKLLQTVLTAAFTFLTYEQTLTRVGKVYDALGLHH